MIRIHEINQELEMPKSRTGAHVSTEFGRAINLTTSPNLSQSGKEWLETAIRRLNKDEHIQVISSRLGRTAGMTVEYNRLVSQMNQINEPMGFDPIIQVEPITFSEMLANARANHLTSQI